MASRFSTREPLDVLIITTGLWFLAKFLRYTFPPLFEPFQGFYDVSSTELGLAFSAFMITYAAMQFPSGVLRDRLGPVLVVGTGGTIAGLASLSLVVDGGFLLVVTAMVFIGLGTGLHKTVSVTLLAGVYPVRTGRVLGIHDTFGTSAGFIAPIVAVFALESVGWRIVFVLGGIAGLAFAGAAFARLPSRLPDTVTTSADARTNQSARSYVSLFTNRRFSLFLVLTIGVAFAYNGVVAFLPMYLSDVGGMSVGLAGAFYSILFAVSVVQIVTGELSDRIGRLSMIVVLLGIATVGLAGLLVFNGVVFVGIAVVLIGVGAHGFRPVRDAYLTGLLPDDIVGGGLGIARSLLMGAGAIAPAIVGWSAARFSFPFAFSLLLITMALATIAGLAIFVSDRRVSS